MIMKNKKIIFICGERKKESIDVIYALFSASSRVCKINGLPRFWHIFSFIFASVILIEDDVKNPPHKVRSFLKKFRDPMIVLTGKGDRLRKDNLLLRFPKNGFIVIDYSLSRKVRKRKVKQMITFGNRKNADIHITDINRGDDTNFKVSYGGSFTPFWLKGRLKNREIYGVICALAVGVLTPLNLVEISTKIKKQRIFT